MTQQSINIPNIPHGAPIPHACVVGNTMATSSIGGRSQATGEIPEDPALQVANCFENLDTILTQSGFKWTQIVRMTFFVTDESIRDAINEHWTSRYPNPAHRPARHTLVTPLRGGQKVQLDALAFRAP
ncbi:RidA family protein [Paraburkholderia tropica]|uniref:RidA family protein n=1 Tax=Paraburkholderia tropica TaxID=92647 RepID=UPI002AB7B4FA|nr:RidA family protein [Paraburkholderia tropica]